MLTPYAAKMQELRDKIFNDPRAADLMLAMIDARRWEEPISYDQKARKQVGIDKALAAAKAPTARGYWTRIALRALIMLELSAEEREELIRLERAEHEKAAELLNEVLDAGPPDPSVELGKRELTDRMAALTSPVKL